MHQHDDNFFDVTPTTVSTSQGQVDLPICYYDASHYMATFPVKAARAQEKLDGLPLEPVLAGGKAMVALSFFKYRNTSIGPYHEVGLALLVVPKGEDPTIPSIAQLPQRASQGTIGFHLLDLPVSTPVADAAGRELWGYPKFVADLSMEIEGEHFCGRVLNPQGEMIMSLQGERGFGLDDELPGLDLLTYSMHAGQLLRTCIRTRYTCDTRGGGSLKLTNGDTSHRMADNIRDLGLVGRSPKLWQTTEHFESVLPAGELHHAVPGPGPR